MEHTPPEDWSDKDGWDRYFEAELAGSRGSSASGCRSLRFLSFVKENGGRAWFSGCGVDPGPRAYAALGCAVLATDLSSVAIAHQERLASTSPETLFPDWPSFLKENELSESEGTLAVAEQDFTRAPPSGTFDVVINCRAFQGLSADAMKSAARSFRAALRPGGAAIIDTINVQGRRRDTLEDSLFDAGFYLPFRKSERWYRDQLEGSGIVYTMILGRAMIPNRGQYPADRRVELEMRDGKILESFRIEYERLRKEEAGDARAALADPATVAAHVVYSTG